jgi:hypothetical protein
MTTEIFTAVFVLLAGQNAPGTPDPRLSDDYRTCMSQTLETYGHISVEAIRMDAFCTAVIMFDPSVSV